MSDIGTMARIASLRESLNTRESLLKAIGGDFGIPNSEVVDDPVRVTRIIREKIAALTASLDTARGLLGELLAGYDIETSRGDATECFACHMPYLDSERGELCTNPACPAVRTRAYLEQLDQTLAHVREGREKANG
jgi:hypothetical protein